jgi:hypothetical protein
MFIWLLKVAHWDMQSDVLAGDEASRQAASLLQAAWQDAKKFPVPLPPQLCVSRAMIASARATSPPTMNRLVLCMRDAS